MPSKEHDHYCPECNRRIEYRLMQGTNYEGVSIREVYLNEKNEIEGWSEEPVLILAANKQEVVEGLVEVMRDVDDMLSATKRPILDEADLELRLSKGQQ